jgi:hypothetical protein
MMTLDEQDKITEITARLRTSLVVLDEYDRDTKEHSGAIWLVIEEVLTEYRKYSGPVILFRRKPGCSREGLRK